MSLKTLQLGLIVGERIRKKTYRLFVFTLHTDCNAMLVGTGDVPSSLSFYQKCGFEESHRIQNFFTDNYDHPMFEDGKQLVDMVYLKRKR
jgi:hypothetical protein